MELNNKSSLIEDHAILTRKLKEETSIALKLLKIHFDMETNVQIFCKRQILVDFYCPCG